MTSLIEAGKEGQKRKTLLLEQTRDSSTRKNKQIASHSKGKEAVGSSTRKNKQVVVDSDNLLRKFKGKDGIEYCIEKLPKGMYDEAIETLADYLPRDDPIMLNFGMSNLFFLFTNHNLFPRMKLHFF